MRLSKTVTVVLVVLVGLVLWAWIDGGPKPQRLIEEPVTLPANAR